VESTDRDILKMCRERNEGGFSAFCSSQPCEAQIPLYSRSRWYCNWRYCNFFARHPRKQHKTLVLGGFFSFSAVGNELVVHPKSESTISEKVLREVERASGAGSEVIPVRQRTELVDFGAEKKPVVVYGLRSEDIPLLLELEEGRLLKRGSSNCLLGSEIAEEHDLNVGERLRVGTQELRIAGILKERGLGFDINPDYAVVVEAKAFVRLFNASLSAAEKEGYNFLIVRVNRLEDVERVKSAIERKVA